MCYRFGQKFVDRVANPKDMVTFSRKKTLASKDSKEGRGEIKCLCCKPVTS